MIPALCQHPTYFQLIALSPDVPIVITRNALSHSQARESISTTHAVRIIGTGGHTPYPSPSRVCYQQRTSLHKTESIGALIYQHSNIRGKNVNKEKKGGSFWNLWAGFNDRGSLVSCNECDSSSSWNLISPSPSLSRPSSSSSFSLLDQPYSPLYGSIFILTHNRVQVTLGICERIRVAASSWVLRQGSPCSALLHDLTSYWRAWELRLEQSREVMLGRRAHVQKLSSPPSG